MEKGSSYCRLLDLHIQPVLFVSHCQRHVVLGFGLSFVVLGFIGTPSTTWQFVVKLGPLSCLFPGRLFFYYSRCWNLVNPHLTNCLRIKAFGDGNNNALSLRADKLFLNKSEDPSNIFSSFIGDKLNKDLYVLFFGLVFKRDFLIEDKFIGGGSGDLGGEGITVILEVELAGELNFEG